MADHPPPANIDGKAACDGGASIDVDLARLIHEHHVPLYRYAFRLCGNVADAEDLVQQTFVVAQEKLHQLRQAESVRSWLFAVLRNSFLKSRRRPRPVSAEGLALDIDSLPEDVSRDDDIDRERLQQVLDGLPDEYRLVLVMFYFEECSYREIAEKLEVPLGTVMSRLSRAKQRMRCGLLAGDDHPADSAPTQDVPTVGRPADTTSETPDDKSSRKLASGARNTGR
ncbi:MAG: sigma-70 family RNA polymerase sigma factor [Pirellulaceae bacterium]